MYKADIKVALKKSIFDPQGMTIKNSLNTIGFDSANEVRVGKFIEVKLNTTDKAQAEKNVQDMCEKLLHNPIIETYEFNISEI